MDPVPRTSATDLEALAYPEWLVPALAIGRDDAVLSQSIEVDLEWWNSRLEGLGRPLFIGGTDDGKVPVTRRDVFALAAAAQQAPAEVLRLLWASMAWGAGNKRRLCHKRIEAVRRGGTQVQAGLLAAAQVAAKEPEYAYELMRPNGRNLVSYLGPAFFTKFLYFAGGDAASNRNLILDARVASSLRTAGWSSLGSTGWPTVTYGRYLELIDRWRGELTARLGREIRGDELEKALFDGAPVTAGR